MNSSAVLDVLRQLVAGVLKISTSDVDPDKEILALGMHSLQALLLFTQIAKDINYCVGIADMLRCATLRELAGTLCAAGVSPDFGQAFSAATTESE